MAARFRLICAALFVALAASACSSASTISAERVAAEPLPTEIPAPSGVGPGGEATSLEVVDVEGLAVITDSNGMAVYGNERDTMQELFCIDLECTSVWVPLEPRDAFISARLDASKYQVLARPDGTNQVAYDGVPLYTWTGDTVVGFPQGAGVAGLWFGLTTDGSRIQ